MKCPRCGNEVSGSATFCTRCGGRLDGDPMVSSVAPIAPMDVDSRFQIDKLLFSQKKFSLVPQYYVYDENGRELFFVRRLLLALKRHVYIYTDRSQRELLLTVRQDRIIEFLNRHFTVVDNAGNVLGRFRRKNVISILRRTWHILDSEGRKIGEVLEDSWGKAMFRRTPLGEYFKTDFIIRLGDRVIGKFIRKWTVFDKYAFDLSEDSEREFDRRLAVGLGALLDSAEGR